MKFYRVFRCMGIGWISFFASLTAGYALPDKKEVDEGEDKGNRLVFYPFEIGRNEQKIYLTFYQIRFRSDSPTALGRSPVTDRRE